MLHIDLFSGIGGFALGLERVGFKTIAFCEIEPYCRAVLRKRWPDVTIVGDICDASRSDFLGASVVSNFEHRVADENIMAYSVGSGLENRKEQKLLEQCSPPKRNGVDIVTGGFPCQPWSVAGRRKGTEDHRDLWPEMLRVVRELNPRWVIAENVPGLDDKRFMALDRTLVDLESAGYEGVPFEIPACGVGAPHLRRRLWIVAHANGAELRQQPRRGSGQNRESAAQLGIYGEAQSVAHTAQHGCGQGDQNTGGGSEGTCTSKERRGLVCTGWWLSEPDVGRVAHGVSARMDRLRALGNSIIPQIAEIIGKAIMEAEK